jgi:hypothetical protein
MMRGNRKKRRIIFGLRFGAPLQLAACIDIFIALLQIGVE